MPGLTYGELADIVEQSEYWVNRQGETLRIEEMDRHYRANVMGFLRERAKPIWTASVAQGPLFMGIWADYSGGSPEGWLELRSLMQKLRALDDRGPLGRRLTKIQNAIYRRMH